MTLGVDYSFARPDPATIKAAGYDFVVRYVAPASESGKALSAGEADALHAAGLSILLVFEDGAQNALGGAAQGTTDGSIARQAAAALGYPQGCPILAAVDFDAQDSQLPTVEAYLAAFAQAVAPWPSAPYGKMNVGDASPAGGDYWETEAWDGTTVDPRAKLYQRVQPTVAHPVAGTDEDVELQSVTMWEPGAPAAPVPQPGSSFPTSVPAPVAPAFPAFPGRLLELRSPLMSGADVRAFQQRMHDRGWDIGRSPRSKYGAIDGFFGTKCQQLAHDFEVDQHLPVDRGIVGPQVWRAMWVNPVTR